MLACVISRATLAWRLISGSGAINAIERVYKGPVAIGSVDEAVPLAIGSDLTEPRVGSVVLFGRVPNGTSDADPDLLSLNCQK